MTTLKKYGYLWATLILFIVSLAGHWTAGWFSYLEEQKQHRQPVEANSYFIEMAKGTLENWQSEFLQLMWQVAGLAFLWHVGSPQSKEGDDRKEEKIDEVIRLLAKGQSNKIIARLDKKYPKN